MKRKESVSRRFCAHWGERTSASAARKALEAAIPSISKSSLPVNLEAAAKYVGIEHILDVEMIAQDGLLSSTRSGTYVASLRKAQHDTRRRFTLAHEVGHAIVYRSIGRLRPESDDGALHCRAETDEEKDEERLCDVLAAELLMPNEQFTQVMEEMGVCAQTIPGIARRFGVSLQALSRRIVESLPYEVGFGLWILNDEKTRLVPKWYLAKNGMTSLESTIALGQPGSACFTDEPVRGWCWLPLHGHLDKYFVDVSPLGSAPNAWIVFFIFNRAAEHIMATISNRRVEVAAQLPLIDQ